MYGWLLPVLIVLLPKPVSPCGGELEGTSGVFTHPSYPENYQPDLNCRWSTTAREKDTIEFTIQELDVESDEQGRCLYDFISILYPDKHNPEKFCGLAARREPNTGFFSNGTGDPIIRFASDDSMQFAGFKVEYKIIRYPYCDDDPCEHEEECVETDEEEQGFRCTCESGWTGAICDEDLDECLDRPCLNQGECFTPEFDMFVCLCKDGYTGRTCDADIDECESNPCENGGTCDDEINGYDCDCLPGYGGLNCEIDINECDSNPCKHSGTCYDQVNKFLCRCQPGYAGADCGIDTDECASEPCQNGGTCLDKENGYECQCEVGYEGRDCEHEIDECDSNPCKNNAHCVDKLDAYDCDCADGFEGTHCETDLDECVSEPCENGGHCFQPSPAMFQCACVPGFVGVTCTEEVDECESNPCVYGSCRDLTGHYACDCFIGFGGPVCEYDIDECMADPCGGRGICNNKMGSFNCTCYEGYSGELCEIEDDACISNPCLNQANCTRPTNITYSCECMNGFKGEHCEKDIEECSSDPCHNGGTCEDEINKFNCVCPSGYGGIACEIELDECDSDPCMNSGHCIDQPSKYECVCQEGYEGTNCEFDEASHCSSSPCLNGGTCSEDDDGFLCACADNFIGETCEEEIIVSTPPPANGTVFDEDQSNCHPYRCLHSGTCIEQDDGVSSCNCSDGFTGKYCETNIDDCASYPCINGGSCVDRVNEYWCICREGYSGLICEDDSGVQWQSDTQLLAALLPSLLFLLLIGLLAATFHIYFRKKRSMKLSPLHSLVEVKPAKNCVKKKKKKSPRKKKVSFKEVGRRRKNRGETVVNYDYPQEKYTPYVEPNTIHSSYNPVYYNPVFDPKPYPDPNMYNLEKGMFYPTGNMPMTQHKKQYFDPYENSPRYKKAFSSPNYSKDLSDDYDPYNDYKDHYNAYKERPKKYRSKVTPSPEEIDSSETKNEDLSESLDSVFDGRESKQHWQDRDADKLKSVPSKHIYVPPEEKHINYDNDENNIVYRKPSLARNGRLKPILRFSEPQKPHKPNNPKPRIQREKTSIAPPRRASVNENDDDYPKTLRNSMRRSQRGNNNRNHYTNPF